MVFITGGAFQGKGKYARERFGEDAVIIDHYHLRVREQLKTGKEPLAEAEKLLKDVENPVIISDETGCGLIPVDDFERRCREESSRVNCFLAGEADEVIRIVSGIGVRIK